MWILFRGMETFVCWSTLFVLLLYYLSNKFSEQKKKKSSLSEFFSIQHLTQTEQDVSNLIFLGEQFLTTFLKAIRSPHTGCIFKEVAFIWQPQTDEKYIEMCHEMKESSCDNKFTGVDARPPYLKFRLS